MSIEGNAVKLVLLGDSGVGKTSIVTQYVSGSAPENVNPTIGAAFVTKDVNIDGQQLELLIWDTAGQEVYRGLAPMYYRSALIAIIVFDVTKAESFDSVSYWIRELKTNVEENIVILVCGNKTDLEDKRVIEFQSASSMASENGALYAETSASTGSGVDRMFQMAINNLLQNKGNVINDGKPNGGVNLKDDTGKQGKKKCCK
ncbi:small GTP-binding protein [Histomonas meleagridis]|uniref:small GTP-binding protein n=1 Tax=Histomonas meleagridis TaxID=135588 RepID=UPI0035593E6D|nr:small GTP-binding protein [Histomonas meleagridis]KAH0804305.1 small GTP-binding protein [Histomonas meleagridis]